MISSLVNRVERGIHNAKLVEFLEGLLTNGTLRAYGINVFKSTLIPTNSIGMLKQSYLLDKGSNKDLLTLETFGYTGCTHFNMQYLSNDFEIIDLKQGSNSIEAKENKIKGELDIKYNSPGLSGLEIRTFIKGVQTTLLENIFKMVEDS